MATQNLELPGRAARDRRPDQFHQGGLRQASAASCRRRHEHPCSDHCPVCLPPDRTKSRRRHNVELPPRVVMALANLVHCDGAAFCRPGGHPYADHGCEHGGQIKTGWRGPIRRAGLDPAFTPPTCRHTWASWHYVLHRDLLRLSFDGGWSPTLLVERYAHLMPAGREDAVRQLFEARLAAGGERGRQDTAAGSRPLAQNAPTGA
jgi:integrase